MEVILNGDSQTLDASNCANLAELVSFAEQSMDSADQSVVVAIELNGQALDPEALSALESKSLDGIEKVSIIERPAREVAHSVLGQAAEYTVKICEAIEVCVEHYRGGRSDLGGNVLADVTDSMSVLTGITYSVSGILIEESQTLADVQAEILPWLEELVEAQSVEDPIRISDTLEYEVSPRIREWGTTMRKLIDGTVLQSE